MNDAQQHPTTNEQRWEPTEPREEEESVTEFGEKHEKEEEEEQEHDAKPHTPRLELSRSRPSLQSRSRSRGRLPAGFTAGFNEGNFDGEEELEMQRTKSQRNIEKGISDDPNLVEWMGPDDPGNV
jgi:hypothetical protein